MDHHLYAIGIMTGNSLDGADLVLTRFGREDGSIADLGAHSVPFPEDHKVEWRAVRAAVGAAGGDMPRAVAALGAGAFARTVARYTDLLVDAVADLRARAGVAVDVIGLHGQTCGHRPPSIAAGGEPYTVQVGDGPGLADRTGVAVVDDFRSDDLMLGGEGAPLAPLHHRHLADAAGVGSIAFANGGNTGNLSLVTTRAGTGEPVVLGWDAGPFNHFPDQIMQRQAGRPCDLDAAVGRRGSIHLDLLDLLFRSAVVTAQGDNFLLQASPKSSDPEWYRLLPELLGEAPTAGRTISLADRVRTATYFATYVLAHSLAGLPADLAPPTHLATCGGGWRNPLTLPDLRALLLGADRAPILPDHAARFARLWAWSPRAVVAPSESLGWDGTAMEARIFADAAVARIKRDPFTLPATTGTRAPAVCGLLRFPGADPARASAPLRAWLDHFRTDLGPTIPTDHPWSRAAAGWTDRT